MADPDVLDASVGNADCSCFFDGMLCCWTPLARIPRRIVASMEDTTITMEVHLYCMYPAQVSARRCCGGEQIFSGSTMLEAITQRLFSQNQPDSARICGHLCCSGFKGRRTAWPSSQEWRKTPMTSVLQAACIVSHPCNIEGRVHFAAIANEVSSSCRSYDG